MTFSTLIAIILWTDSQEPSSDEPFTRDADAGSIMHELLHARSVSYHTPLQFRASTKVEEGAVSYLTKAISQQQGMFYNPSYREQVTALEQMRSFLRPDGSDLDFALEFYNVDMTKRYRWLQREIGNATLQQNDREYLNRILQDCLMERRFFL